MISSPATHCPVLLLLLLLLFILFLIVILLLLILVSRLLAVGSYKLALRICEN
jgi:hypothetical protein